MVGRPFPQISLVYPGCSGHIHQSLSDGRSNLFYDAQTERRMSPLLPAPT